MGIWGQSPKFPLDRIGENNLIQRYNIQDFELSRKEKKKNKFITMKDNTMKSLKEVEFFLGNWKRVSKGIKLYKILK